MWDRKKGHPDNPTKKMISVYYVVIESARCMCAFLLNLWFKESN
jgi:hypothetical protein